LIFTELSNIYNLDKTPILLRYLSGSPTLAAKKKDCMGKGVKVG